MGLLLMKYCLDIPITKLMGTVSMMECGGQSVYY